MKKSIQKLLNKIHNNVITNAISKFQHRINKAVIYNNVTYTYDVTKDYYLIYAKIDKEISILVKAIPNKDSAYSLICAEELCDKLNDDPYKFRKNDK
jgi:hypothetical protein